MELYSINSYSKHQNILSLVSALDSSPRSSWTRPEVAATSIDWLTTNLFQSIVRIGIPLRVHANRTDAYEELAKLNSGELLATFEERSWVRFILGRLHIPMGIRAELTRAVSAAKDLGGSPTPTTDTGPNPQSQDSTASGPFTEVETAALSALVKLVDLNDLCLWIPAKSLKDLAKDHAKIAINSPTFETIREDLLVKRRHEGTPGFELSIKLWCQHAKWSAFFGPALALHWTELERSSSSEEPGQLFRIWLEYFDHLGALHDTISYIAAGPRETLMNCIFNAIVDEPDLIGIENEVKRARWELASYFRSALQPLPVDAPGSLLSIYRWCEKVLRNHGRYSVRSLLDTLIALLVIHDSAFESNRVLKLLQVAQTRPHLVQEICELLRGSARKGIAYLIATPETSSLGICLLLSLDVTEPSYAQTADSEYKQTQREFWKTILWNSSLAVLLGTVHQETLIDHDKFSRTVAEVLLLASDAANKFAPRRDTQLPKKTADINLRAFVAGLYNHTETVLEVLTPDFIGVLGQCGKSYRNSNLAYAGFPMVEMGALFALLSQARPTMTKSTPFETSCALAIVKLYTEEMSREITDQKEIIHFGSFRQDSSAFDWTNLALVLESIDEADKLIRPTSVDIGSRIKAIPTLVRSLGTDDIEGSEWQLRDAWAIKVRTQVSILVEIHKGILNLQPSLGESTKVSEYPDLIKKIEDRLYDFVLTYSHTQTNYMVRPIFDWEIETGYGTDNGHNVSLLSRVISAFNTFVVLKNDTTFETWISNLTDPIILLTILEESTLATARERASEQLKKVNIKDFLGDQRWVPQIYRLAERAAAAENITIVEHVLEFGDNLLREHAKNEDWQIFAYEMRLRLAYLKDDITLLDSIEPPKNVDKFRGTGVRDSDRIRDSKKFYRGLVLLKTNPNEAHRIFDNLVKLRPTFVGDAVNRFAAALAATKKISDSGDRLKALHSAKYEWDLVAATFSELDVDIDSVQYNILSYFDESGQTNEFDLTWADLSIERKVKAEFLSLFIANSRRRGLTSRLEHMLKIARPFHYGSDGSLTPDFVQIEAEVHSEAEKQNTRRLFQSQSTAWIEGLRDSYLKLRSASTLVKAQVVGQEDQSVHVFLFGMIIFVAKELIKRLQALQGNIIENKYNDIVASLLSMRISFINLVVKDQDRGGLSESGDDSGERDIVVVDDMGDLALIEALKLDSVSESKILRHLQKLEDNYNPEGLRMLYVLVYYTGDSWERFWDGYCNYVKTAKLKDGTRAANAYDPIGSTSSRNLRALCLEYGIAGDSIYVYHIGLNLKTPQSEKQLDT